MKKNGSMNSINIFILMISEKVQLKFTTIFKYLFHRLKVNKFVKTVYNGSPSFTMLWKMADFVKYAEDIFFYSNVKSNYIYSSRDFTSGQNGFRVCNKYDSGDEVKITIKLFNESRKVLLEIDKISGENRKTTMTFVNDDWVNPPTIYDEMMLEEVIKVINDKILTLFKYCYERR